MENYSRDTNTDRRSPSEVIPWDFLENRITPAFTTAGLLLTASMFVPVILARLTDWAWTAGLFLAGLGVLAVVSGLFGLYRRVNAHSPRLAMVGVLSASIAGLSALGLLVMGGIALLGGAVMGIKLGTPLGAFSVVAITLASGFAVGLLSVGIPMWQSRRPARVAGLFMLIGGGLLLVPIVGELARFGFGVDWPSWVLLPIIGLVSLDTLAIGTSFRLATPASENPGQ